MRTSQVELILVALVLPLSPKEKLKGRKQGRMERRKERREGGRNKKKNLGLGCSATSSEGIEEESGPAWQLEFSAFESQFGLCWPCAFLPSAQPMSVSEIPLG